MGATNSKRAQPQPQAQAQQPQAEAGRREKQAQPSKPAAAPAAAAAAAAPPIPARPQQQPQLLHQPRAAAMKATPSPHSRRAHHYSSPLKGAAERNSNGDLRAIQQNRSPRVAEYTPRGGRQRGDKKKRAADPATAAAARDAAQADKENAQLCPPPISAMLAASTPLAKSPSTSFNNGAAQRHRAVPPLAAIPPPSASTLGAAAAIVSPPAAAPAAAAIPARRSSVEIAAAAAPQPVMRKVQVGPSRRSSEENVAAFTAAALAAGTASASASAAQPPAAAVAASVKAPSAISMTASAVSSTSNSAAPSARSSAASSNASSTDISPKSATSAAASTPPIMVGASLTVSATVAASSMAATNKEGAALPVIARSPRGRSRSVVGGASLPAISPRPTHAAVAAAASSSSSSSVAASATAGAAPIFSPATAFRIARSSSVPPSMARTSSAFRASFISPPRNRGPALSGLPNSLPLDRFLDAWAWSPPLESADPFHPASSHSVTLDPLRFGPSARGLLLAMDRIALLTPTPSQLELLWNYTEGLGGHEPLPPAGSTPSIPAGTASISRARLMLLASECSSKLHHQLAVQLKGKTKGGPRLKKWRSVLAVIERERPFFLPQPLAASPSDKKLEASVLLRSALGHSTASQLAHLKSLTALICSHLDLNGDGRVTKAEFMAGWTNMAAAVFGQVEHTGNAGVVSKNQGVISCTVM